MIPFGGFGTGHYVSILAINDSGQAVGVSDNSGFITGTNSVGMTEISDRPYDINNFGQVVGSSVSAYGNPDAYITGNDGVDMINLGTLGGYTSLATHINDSGEVVGTSETANGDVHSFLYSPWRHD